MKKNTGGTGNVPVPDKVNGQATLIESTPNLDTGWV